MLAIRTFPRRQLRLGLLGVVAVFALTGALAPEPAEAKAIDTWGDLSCQQGRVTVKAPYAVQNYPEKAWTTDLYQWNGSQWTGPYVYGPQGWGDRAYSWKYWNNDNWFQNGQAVGPAGVGSVFYPVPTGAFYYVQNYAFDTYYQSWDSGLSSGVFRNENSPAFDTRQYYCLA